MARLKGIKEIKDLQSVSLEDICKDHPDFEKIARIFKENFCFDESDIKLCIANIYDRVDPDLISNLHKLFYAFMSKEDISKVDKAARRALALQVVNSTLEIYDETNQNNYAEFIEVVNEAKSKGINPYRLAIKSNIMTANVEAFEGTLNALTSEYVDKHTGKREKLFSEDEMRALIHKCASVAYKATEEKVQAVLDILGSLLYDKERGKYYVEPKKLIQKVPSLLALNVQNLKDTIDFLQDKKLFNMDKPTLLARIVESPSILCTDALKMYAIEDRLRSNFQKLLSKDVKSSNKEAMALSKSYAHKIVGNINNLTQLDKVNEDAIVDIADILQKYLGAKNAVSCMHNMSVLSSNPDYLEFVLATIVRSEKLDGNKGLREAFISSPFSFLAMTENSKKQIKTESERTNERGPREKFALAEIPDVNVDDERYKKLSAKISASRKQGFTYETIKKVTEKLRKEQEKLEAERKAKEEAERREWAEQKARERAEQKARKRASRREARRNAYKIQSTPTNIAQTLKPAETVKEVKTLAQLQAERRAEVKIRIGDEINIDLNFSRLFWPIIAGLPKENRPLYNKIESVVRSMSLYEVNSTEISQNILNSAQNWKDFMYDEETGSVRTDLIEALARTDTDSGKTNLQAMVDVVKTMEKDLAKSEIPLKEAQNTLAQCCKNKSVKWPAPVKPAKDEKKKNQNETEYEQINPLELNRRVGLDVQAYIDSLDEKCVETYGCKLTDFFTDEKTKETYENIRKFLTINLTPNTCGRLDEMLCHWYYFEVILNKFIEGKGEVKYMYLQPKSKIFDRFNPVTPNAIDQLLNPSIILDEVNGVLAQNNLSNEGNTLIINDLALEKIGIKKETANDFADTYRSMFLAMAKVLAGVYHKVSADGDMRIKFHEDKENEYLIDYEKGSHRVMELMPTIIFKDLYLDATKGEA